MKAITLRYSDEDFKKMQEVKAELNEVWEKMVLKAVLKLKPIKETMGTVEVVKDDNKVLG